jgi:hypothetical protein
VRLIAPANRGEESVRRLGDRKGGRGESCTSREARQLILETDRRRLCRALAMVSWIRQ